MIERRIVRRYATALFSAATKAEVVDRVESDLGLVSYTLESSPGLVDAVKSPLVPASKKRDILKSIFGDKVDPITLSYLYLLVDKRREEALLQTEEEYILLANEARGMVSADVTTAVDLSKEQEASLKAKLSKMTGKTVEIVKIVDPTIMGGALVKIGDRVIDGSVKGQLAVLREQLLS
ncbi:MAG: F0F1 ATP synthase subunit delta [Armatimonadetes bacterium]|nr:F0F1 ATP synthase subunit delta [Armatimonadota bacterium]